MESKNRVIVSVDSNYLIGECAKDKDKLAHKFESLERRYKDFQYETFGYKVFDEGFCDNLDIWSRDNSLSVVALSYEEFLYKLETLLNIKSKSSVDSEDLSRQFEERLKALSNVKSEVHLSYTFPALYDIYKRGIDFLNTNDAQYSYAIAGEPMKDLIGICNSNKKYADRCGISRDFRSFINAQVKGLTNMVNNRGKMWEFIYKNNISTKEFDPLKLRLVTINEILNSDISLDDNETLKNIIEAYVKNDIYDGASITDSNGIVLDNEMIKTKANNKLVTKVSDLSSLPWIAVPSEKDGTKKKATIRDRKAFGKPSYLKRMMELKDMVSKKLAFYERSPYELKLTGVGSYEGYVAYIYSNGKVIADTIPDEANLSVVTDNAIYIFPAEDFIELSMKDKKTLKHDNRVKTINHNKTWIERTAKEITEPSTEETKEMTRRLIKTVSK